MAVTAVPWAISFRNLRVPHHAPMAHSQRPPFGFKPGMQQVGAGAGMPLHLNGVLMTTTQFQPLQYTRARANSGHVSGQDTGSLVTRDTMPTLGHRTSSLEMLNNDSEWE